MSHCPQTSNILWRPRSTASRGSMCSSNNAGVSGPTGCIEDVGWEEWERTLRVNLFGSVLCCRAVLPHFKSNGYGKIIQLSGGGATSPLPRISSYAASKTAVVRFSETLAEEVRGTGIDVNSIAPGALNTRMLDELIDAGPESVGQPLYERALDQRSSGGVPLDLPARLAVFLASAQSDGITGKLISAPGSVGEAAFARRRSPQFGRLYPAAHCPGRPRPPLGLSVGAQAHLGHDDQVGAQRRPSGSATRVDSGTWSGRARTGRRAADARLRHADTRTMRTKPAIPATARTSPVQKARGS